MGVVYLIHFWKPIAPGKHTCQHYVGWTNDLDRRMEEHRNGTGSRLCQVANERGIPFSVARVWQGDRTLERQIKNRHGSNRLCPFCRGVEGDVNFYS